MRTLPVFFAALVIAFFGAHLSVVALAAGGPVLTYTRGDVTAKPSGGQWARADKGLALAAGDMVKTGARAKAEISFPSGVMRLFENTVVVIPAVADRAGKKDLASVQLDSGSTAFHVDPAGGGFTVKTRHVIAGVKGTKFGVTVSEKDTQVVVYFGQVEVTDPSGGKGVVAGTNQTSTSTAAGPGAPQGAPTGDGFSGWSDADSAPSRDPATESQGGTGGDGGKHHSGPMGTGPTTGMGL